jgi:F-box-like
MSQSQSEAIEAVRKFLDAKINRLEESLSTLRYQSNARAPINSLPPELLSEIFTAIAADPRSYLEDTVSVCRHWRETALNHARLWTTIDFTTPEWRTNLSRTKEASLSLIVDNLSTDFNSFVEVLHQNASRIRACELFVNEFDNPFVGYSFPILEDLTMSTYNPLTFDLSHLPNLRQLVLTDRRENSHFSLSRSYSSFPRRFWAPERLRHI